MSSKRESVGSLGGRIKSYEAQYNQKVLRNLPMIVRLDGRAFHTFTRGMCRPYDINMSKLMIYTMNSLVEAFSPKIAYVQSDEISLLFTADNEKSELPFIGKVNKINSIFAAITSVYFDRYKKIYFPCFDKVESFDCRTFSVPSKEEACNYFLWRERDATKNSISMAAQSMYSNKELLNKNQSHMQEMLFQKGVNWNDYPIFFKRGTWARKVNVEKINPQDMTTYTRSVCFNSWLKIPLAHMTMEDKLKFIFEGEDEKYTNKEDPALSPS